MRERVSTRVASYGNPHSNCKGVKVLTQNAVEEFRPGYPRYTALLSAHPSFHNFRRFTRTRLRLLLLKQDEIAVLEESLDKIDSAEECELFLGCRRRDTNPARQEILRQLKLSLAEYGRVFPLKLSLLGLHLTRLSRQYGGPKSSKLITPRIQQEGRPKSKELDRRHLLSYTSRIGLP
jgi:hypothetical protein